MDYNRFDALTRTMTAAGSRRQALAAALGGALAIALGAAPGQEAAAKKKPCPPCKKRKQGKCKKKLPDGTGCRGGACQNGSCVATAESPSSVRPVEEAASVPPPPPDCTTAASCPAPPASQLCAQATCIGGKCGIGPKAANTVCRPIAGECDITAEVCEGTGLNCPANQFKPANTPCTSDGKSCTRDICDGSSSTCSHPPVANGTPCGTEQACCGGTCCIAGQACSERGTCCLGLFKVCTRSEQCCTNNCLNGLCQ